MLASLPLAGAQELRGMLEAVGRLWMTGVTVDWQAFMPTSSAAVPCFPPIHLNASDIGRNRRRRRRAIKFWRPLPRWLLTWRRHYFADYYPCGRSARTSYSTCRQPVPVAADSAQRPPARCCSVTVARALRLRSFGSRRVRRPPGIGPGFAAVDAGCAIIPAQIRRVRSHSAS